MRAGDRGGPRRRGQGLSIDALHALRRNAERLGLAELVAPVRPPDKADEPWADFEEYISRRRADGLPGDRWLRVHLRAGGKLDRIAPFSMIVAGTLDRWRQWTGLPFDRDGLVEVQGALQPVMVSQRLGCAVYTEPNIWVRHPIR